MLPVLFQHKYEINFVKILLHGPYINAHILEIKYNLNKLHKYMKTFNFPFTPHYLNMLHSCTICSWCSSHSWTPSQGCQKIKFNIKHSLSPRLTAKTVYHSIPLICSVADMWHSCSHVLTLTQLYVLLTPLNKFSHKRLGYTYTFTYNIIWLLLAACPSLGLLAMWEDYITFN